MPTIAMFYGIAIQMSYVDHNPPHLHARYGSARALFRLADGRIIAGALPPTATKLVHDWIALRREALEENWRRGQQQVPFETIPGPDDERD